MALLVLLALLFGACKLTPGSNVPDGQSPQDAGWEALPDAGPDVALPDAGPDAVLPDAAPDAPERCEGIVTLKKAPRSRPPKPAKAAKLVKIVGGDEAPVGAWTSTVALETPDGWQYCGATLARAPGSTLTQSAVTAAHCDVRPGEFVVVGKNDLREPGGRVEVTEVVTHERYKSAETGYDVQVLKLATPVPVEPYPMVPAGWQDPGVPVTVVGWGLTLETGSPSPKLRQVDVMLYKDSACQQAYPDFYMSTMLCAGYTAGGKDTCYGDSGGGMFVKIGGVWHWAAITSLGNGCARPSYPGVYTAIGAVRPWLDRCLYR